jgi:hypothetical protein
VSESVLAMNGDLLLYSPPTVPRACSFLCTTCCLSGGVVERPNMAAGMTLSTLGIGDHRSRLLLYTSSMSSKASFQVSSWEQSVYHSCG